MKVVFFNKFWLSNLSTSHCQSPCTQFLVYQYHHIHFHRTIITATARTELGAILDLPTSRTQIFSRARSASGRFFLCFLRPTTGTGNEKRRILRKSSAGFKPNFRQWHQLFEHRFFWQPHLTNWTIASEAGASFVITGIHLSSLFSHLNPPGCGKLGQHTYHRSKLSFNRGRGELLLVLVEAWPIPPDFFLNIRHLSSLTCEIPVLRW